MSMRYIGAVMSATPPVTTSSSAGGIWSMTQYEQAAINGNWPRATFNFSGSFNTSTTGGDVTNGIAIDSSRNVYTISYINDNISAGYALIVKYDVNGNVIWQKKASLTGTSNEARGTAITVAANGYIYCGIHSCTTSSYFGTLILKLDSSGNIVLQFRTDYYSSMNSYPTKIIVDSSNNIYVSNSQYVSGSYRGLIGKYDSSGNSISQYGLSQTYFSANGFVLNSSSNRFFVGGTAAYGYWQGVVFKADSSGAGLLNKSIGSTNDSIMYQDVAIDPTQSFIYCVGGNNTNNGAFLITKYDTANLGITWQKSINTYNGGYSFLFGVYVDNSGYVYSCGYNQAGTGNKNGIIVKYDSSGTIQWQRQIVVSGTHNSVILTRIVGDNSGNLYVSGSLKKSSNGYSVPFAITVPITGSKTGTYVLGGGDTVTYSAGTGSPGTTTYTQENGAGNYSDFGGNTTTSNTSLSDTTFTPYTVTLP
jgi:hypothetical protein